MKIASYSAFSTDVRQKGLEFALKHTVALGFDAVEVIYTRRDALPTTANAKAERTRFDFYGMPVACYSVAIDISTEDTAPIEALKRHLECAAILGSPYLHHTLLPTLSKKPNAPTYTQVLPRVLDAAAQVAEYAAGLGITCLYEPQGFYFNGIAGLDNFFSRLKQHCPNVGICADAGNPLFLHEDPVALARHFAPHVRHVHVKNYAFSEAEPSANERYLMNDGLWMGAVPLSAGTVDIPAFLTALPDYDGYISIEANGTDDELRAAIAYLRQLPWART